MAAPHMDEAALDDLRSSMSSGDFAMLLQLCRADLVARSAILLDATEALDRGSLERALHHIVGTAGNIGAMKLVDAARQLEQGAAHAPDEALRLGKAEIAALVGETLAALDRLAGAEG